MAIREQAEVTLNINGQAAAKQLDELQKKSVALSESIRKAYEAGDVKGAKKLTTEFRKVEAEMKKVGKNATDLTYALNHLSTATPKELHSIMRRINAEIQSGAIKRGTAEWAKANETLAKVSNELKKIKAEQAAFAPMSQRISAGFQRIKGTVIGLTAAFAGVATAVNGMRNYAKQKDTSRAGLKALTGLDDDSIQWLQTQAEQMSQTMDETGLRVTQSADQILEAYKLVGSAKPELLGVKEDLNAVTVEAIRLSQAAGIDLNDAVAAVTVSMNQFGAGADQTAEFVNVLAAGSKAGAVGVENINEAVVKSGVAAKQAGLSIQDLVGAIETVGERGLQGAKAGTGLSSFFLNLATGADETNPKIVGMSKALENLKNQHLSEAEMVKRFGKETYNVASILIQGQESFDKYREAVTGTSVAVEQAAIMGDTMEAKSAQLKNQLKELGQQVYKDIQPVITLFLGKSTTILKVAATLLKVIKEYGTTIAAIVAPLVAYNVALALSNVLHSKGVLAIVAYTKSLFSMNTVTKAATAAKYLLASATLLLSGNFKKATVAFKAFSRALALNPIGLIATAIAAVVVGLIAWSRREKELTKEQRQRQAINQMNLELEKKVNDQTADEISRIEKLRNAIHNKNLSEKTRLQAIQDLQKIIPGYNAQIDREGNIINENTKAIEAYITALKKAARAKAADEMLTQTTREKLAAEAQLEDVKKRLELERQASELVDQYGISAKSDNADVQAIIDKHSYGIFYVEKEMSKLEKENKSLIRQLDELEAKEKALLEMIAKDQVENENNPAKVTTIDENSPAAQDRTKQLAALELQAKKAKDAIEQAFADNKTTYAQYKNDLLKTDEWLVGRQQALYNQSEKEWWEYNEKRRKLEADRLKLNDELLQMEANDELQALHARYARWEMTTVEYQERQATIEADYLKRRRDNYNTNSKEWADLNKQYNEKVQEQDRRRIAVSVKELEAENEEMNRLLALRLAEGKMTEDAYNEAVYRQEINHLNALRDKYSEFSDDYISISKKIEDAEARHQQAMAKAYTDALKEFNNTYTTKGAHADYQQGVATVDKLVAGGSVSDDDAARAKSALAQKLLDAEMQHAGATNSTIIDTYRARYEKIAELEQQGVITHEQAEKAKLQATNDMLDQVTQIYQSAWSSIDTVLQASSNLIQANTELETTKIEKEYDKRIEKAGRNSRKVQKLEAERDEKLRAMKTKANEKQMKIELAQAIASTAMAAIQAYQSGAAIPVAGIVLGPLAAAAALAAGAIQIATIKKSHQAEAAGYAQGGFTPSGRWDQVQGYVHSNEFVANRYATGNREIAPALRLIDRAQRNNTVQNLTAADVSASLRTSTSPDVVAAVNSNSQQAAAAQVQAADNTAAMAATAAAVDKTAEAIDRLNRQLDEGITAVASITGRNGIDEQQKKYNRLLANAR